METAKKTTMTLFRTILPIRVFFFKGKVSDLNIFALVRLLDYLRLDSLGLYENLVTYLKFMIK